MTLVMRNYQSEEDYWRIRAFLREVFLLNGRRELSWQAARLDYWRWHLIENCKAVDSMEAVIFLWETEDGKIAAVLNPEDRGMIYLQTHPDFRTPELEEAMIAVAEEKLTVVSQKDGRKVLWVHAHNHDSLRQDLLQRRGYDKVDLPEVAAYERVRWLDAPIPDATIPAGYTVRALGDIDELPARSWASWRGFHPDAPDSDYEGWEWYKSIQRAPLYRRDLDIVAVAPEGEITAFCTFWYDDVTRTGYIEPVATVPEHLRKGLGKAIITEALRRLKNMGGVAATVAGFSDAANALYSAVVAPDYQLNEPWVKRL